MPVNARTKRLLTKADQYAAHKARGCTNLQAWRLVTPGWEKLNDQAQHSKSYTFSNHPLVASRVAEVLRNTSVSAMINAASALDHSREMEALAIKAGSFSGAAAYWRIGSSIASLLRENIIVSDDRPQLKADLAKLEQLDPASAAWFRNKLGMNEAPALPRDDALPNKPSDIN